jgi:hypothetical protein
MRSIDPPNTIEFSRAPDYVFFVVRERGQVNRVTESELERLLM